MRYGDGGLLGSSPGGDAVILRAEIRSFGAGGRPRRLHQRLSQPWVALAYPTALALAGALVVPRAQSRPGSEVRGTPKAAHVRSDLGHHRLSRRLAHPRDRVQELDRLLKRARPLLDLLAQPLDAGIQFAEVAELLPQQEPLVFPHDTGQRCLQGCLFSLQPALGHRGQQLGILDALDHRLQHLPPGDPEHVGHHRGRLDVGSLQDLLNPVWPRPPAPGSASCGSGPTPGAPAAP